MKDTKAKKDYEFFRYHAGQTVSVNGIAEYTGRAISTVKIYISKKWHFFLKKQADGYFVSKNVKDIPLEEFLNLYRQETSPGPQYIQPLDTIDITHFQSIKNITLESLSEKKEIYLLGENGTGKTIFLQAIVLALTSEDGDMPDYMLKYFADEEFSGEAIPKDSIVFGYGISRFRPSEASADKYGFSTLFDREVMLLHPVRWLERVERLELKADKEKHTKKNVIALSKVIDFIEQIINIEEEKEFKIQKTDTSFIFIERGKELEFEQLADGYRSILIWLCDLLNRLTEAQPWVSELEGFKGTVLIDEIDMLLHPKWEKSIVRKIRKKLPNIQWFLTTHSPTLILGASEDAVFYKMYKEDGVTQVSAQYSKTEFTDYLLNGIITSPLFDLETSAMPGAKASDKLYTGDFLYEEIHKKVKSKIKDKPEQLETIRNIIDDALNELEGEGKL